jgi:hypothetical protein
MHSRWHCDSLAQTNMFWTAAVHRLWVKSAEISRHRRFRSAADTHRDWRHLRSAGSGQQGKSQQQSARTDQEMADGAIKRGRLTYSAIASAKIAFPCCVCKYQSVKRKT